MQRPRSRQSVPPRPSRITKVNRTSTPSSGHRGEGLPLGQDRVCRVGDEREGDLEVAAIGKPAHLDLFGEVDIVDGVRLKALWRARPRLMLEEVSLPATGCVERSSSRERVEVIAAAGPRCGPRHLLCVGWRPLAPVQKEVLRSRDSGSDFRHLARWVSER